MAGVSQMDRVAPVSGLPVWNKKNGCLCRAGSEDEMCILCSAEVTQADLFKLGALGRNRSQQVLPRKFFPHEPGNILMLVCPIRMSQQHQVAVVIISRSQGHCSLRLMRPKA